MYPFFLNVWYNSDMKLPGLGLRFAHLVFLFLFVIGVLRFSIFFVWLTVDKLYCYIYSFIHSLIYLLYVFMYVHICTYSYTCKSMNVEAKVQGWVSSINYFSFILETTSATEPRIFWFGLADSTVRFSESPLSTSPMLGLQGVYHCAWLLKWTLGIQTQVLMHERQALLLIMAYLKSQAAFSMCLSISS